MYIRKAEDSGFVGNSCAYDPSFSGAASPLFFHFDRARNGWNQPPGDQREIITRCIVLMSVG